MNLPLQGEYVFAENNPFTGDPQALEKGKDLFRYERHTRNGQSVEACMA
jgi:hypothetical protein